MSQVNPDYFSIFRNWVLDAYGNQSTTPIYECRFQTGEISKTTFVMVENMNVLWYDNSQVRVSINGEIFYDWKPGDAFASADWNGIPESAEEFFQVLINYLYIR